MTTAMAHSEPRYPAPLRSIPDAPGVLFVRGTLPERRPAVAIVGARAASGHGMGRARDLARDLARGGALVVSGGAIGIDAAAHLGALDAGAPTVAVLATGLDAPYPWRNRPLFDEIVRRGGALLTSFQPGVPLRRWHFPRRNRVMAGLCDAVVVVEATEVSGSLYTARAAIEYGRVLGACPGTPGVDALLAQGAALVESAADVLAALAGRPRLRTVALPEPDSDEAVALAALDTTLPRDAGAVLAMTGLDARRAVRALSALHVQGLALAVPGGGYVRSALVAPTPQPTETIEIN